MPTGYTSMIGDGATFEEFVWVCARAFGALVTMRDAPSDAPIPEEFKPSTFYAERISETLAAIHDLDDLDRVGLTERMLAEHGAARDRNIERARKTADLHDRYEAMLRRVQNWTPPSPEHVEMKAFMLDQIRQSIEWDCHAYEEPLPPDNYLKWRDQKKESLANTLTHAREEHAKELERVQRRNEWPRHLRDSVPQPIKTTHQPQQ